MHVYIFFILCFIAQRIDELHEKIITRKKVISVCRSLKGITYSCKRKCKNQETVRALLYSHV